MTERGWSIAEKILLILGPGVVAGLVAWGSVRAELGQKADKVSVVELNGRLSNHESLSRQKWDAFNLTLHELREDSYEVKCTIVPQGIGCRRSR